MKRGILIILFLAMLFSCRKPKKEVYIAKDTIVKYAKGFDIIKKDSITTIVVKQPYPNATQTLEYTFSSKTNTQHIQTPIQKIIVTSTTHIPMLELLNSENTLVGFPHTQYVSSEKTRTLIEKGNIKEIGQEANLNTEVVLALQPDAIIGFSTQKINKSLSIIEQNKIPVLINGDWLEETPLGRAEWIKFFGVLFNKEKEADSIFKNIEVNYKKVKELASKTTTQPTILSGGIMNNGIWNLPAGESFMATLLQDANSNYLWKNTKGKGSLSLSFESVLDKGQNADFWIAPGYFSSKKQLINSNKHYQKFKAFQDGKLYTPNLKKGETGGIIYFELAPTRPDLVLKDLIKIIHPTVLPNYEMTFFEKMK